MNAGLQLSVVAATGLIREARIAADPRVRAVAGGGDAAYLADALEREARRGACGIISFGIAGGLRSGFPAGTWLIGKSVATLTSRWHCDDAWTRTLCERLPGAVVVDLAGSDAPVTEPAAKRTLHAATHATAVDMESHVAARIAAAHRLPFAAFRVVADTVERTLPTAATIALAPGGTINGGAVARSLARRPGQIPLLVQSAIDARAALRALLRGRRRLGAALGYPDLRELAFDVR